MAISHTTHRKIVLSARVLLIGWVVISVCMGQLFAPTVFGSVGKSEGAVLQYMRAIVKLGDAYLIRNTFHDELVKSYPVVLETYLKENTLLQKLKEVELRSPMSRDVLTTQAILYKRMGDIQKYEEYASRVWELDPATHRLP